MSAQTPYTRTEVAVGLFVSLGVVALAYLSITLGGLRLGSRDAYIITARFSSVGGLLVGDPVKLAGVRVGRVEAIRLEDYVAVAELQVERAVSLPEDTMASIQSSGLLGDSYVSLSPGAAEADLQPGGQIRRTEPAWNLTELLSKYAFGSPLAEPRSAPSEGDEQDRPAGGTTSGPFGDPLGAP